MWLALYEGRQSTVHGNMGIFVIEFTADRVHPFSCDAQAESTPDLMSLRHLTGRPYQRVPHSPRLWQHISGKPTTCTSHTCNGVLAADIP